MYSRVYRVCEQAHRPCRLLLNDMSLAPLTRSATLSQGGGGGGGGERGAYLAGIVAGDASAALIMWRTRLVRKYSDIFLRRSGKLIASAPVRVIDLIR